MDDKSEATKRTEHEDELLGLPSIAILGVGGAGNNSMSRLTDMGRIEGVDMVAINTDKSRLDSTRCEKKLLIGRALTKGLGTGGSPDIGRKAAEMEKEKLQEIVRDKNLVFLTAGMGGGTGTGALPVVAEVAKEIGAIVVAMVSFPFEAERIRRRKAIEGIEELRGFTDTVVVLENDRLVKYVPNLPVNEAFKVMDELIAGTMKGMAESITQPSLVIIDYADLKAVMEVGGVAVMLVGETEKTEDMPRAVVQSALSHPLLEANYRGAKGALIHITGGPDFTIKETNDIVSMLTQEVNQNANVIWGARIRKDFGGRVKVTAIMTGVEPRWVFDREYKEKLPPIEFPEKNIMIIKDRFHTDLETFYKIKEALGEETKTASYFYYITKDLYITSKKYKILEAALLKVMRHTETLSLFFLNEDRYPDLVREIRLTYNIDYLPTLIISSEFITSITGIIKRKKSIILQRADILTDYSNEEKLEELFDGLHELCKRGAISNMEVIKMKMRKIFGDVWEKISISIGP